MAKKESNFLNMTLSLAAVTFIASAALGYVYELTKEPIAKSKLEKQIKAIKSVVPEFSNRPLEEKYELIDQSGNSLEAYPAKDEQGNLVGVAIKTLSKKGYGGEVWLMVGLLPDGKIYDVAVLEHKETPGLGTKMTDDKFKNQFLMKDPGQWNMMVEKDGGEVEALTGATITSRAYCDAIQLAYDSYMKGGQHE